MSVRTKRFRIGEWGSTLRQATVQEKTIKKYKRVRRYFYRWIEEHRYEWPTEIDGWDELGEGFLEWGRKYKRPAYWGQTLAPALVFMNPYLKGKLRRTRQAAKGLSHLTPVKSKLPISPKLTWAIAVTLVQMRKQEAAIAILLMFTCYLRMGEVLGLRRFAVAFPGDPGVPTNTRASITILQTKTGPDQAVTIEQPLVEALLRRHRGRDTSDTVLFPSLSVYKLSKWLQEALMTLGINKGIYFGHGFRGGGAGFDRFSERRSLSEIKFRGRWKSEAYEIYVRRCRRMLLKGGLPEGKPGLVGALFELDHGAVFDLPKGRYRFIG